MNVDEQTQLLAELTGLLERQIDLARRGSSADLEQLAGRCGPLIERIMVADLLEKPEFRNTCSHLKKLYQDLCLRLSAQKDDTAAKLSHVHKGKKMLLAYRNSMR